MTVEDAGELVAKLEARYATNEPYPTLGTLHDAARANLSDEVWNYLWTGTGDEVTARRNVEIFSAFRFNNPLFSGVANPRTETTFLDLPLTFPVLIAPFGYERNFHAEGHLAVARAAQAAGVKQIVPTVGSFSLERIAEASTDAAAIFQLSFVGPLANVLQMIERAANAGYRYICVTYSPARQWRERLFRDNFSPGAIDDGPANFGPSLTDPDGVIEQHLFTEPRWDWARAKQAIKDAALPVIIKGVSSREDAAAAVEAGAAGLYVSNYGGRELDRTRTTIESIVEVREEVGPAVPILLDSGVRRGSDIAMALALGADAVAIGRLAALGLAAAGEEGVRRTLELLREEFWSTLAHLGCSDVSQLSPSNLYPPQPNTFPFPTNNH